MTVGDRIKFYRELRGISQEQLGDLIGVSKQAIYKYEKNIVSNLPLDRLEQMATALGTTGAVLMGWEKDYNVFKKTTRQELLEAVSEMSDEKCLLLYQIAAMPEDKLQNIVALLNL